MTISIDISKYLLLPILLIFNSFSYAQPLEELKLTSWNLEWLTVTPASSVKPSQRSTQDFDALARHFSKVKPQILAFQEVDSIEAIRKVVGDDYKILISDRAKKQHQNKQFKNLNQYTGFAIANSIPYQDPNDINLLDQTTKLRFASYVIITNKNRQPLHLLSVHLKAGCSGKYQSSQTNCRILKQQGEALNRWILARIKQQQAFIILGDFNHNLSVNNDWLWQSLSKNALDNIYLTTKKTAAKCKVRSQNTPLKTHQFKSVIDHILVSKDFKDIQATQEIFKSDEVLKYQLSDHCPVSVVLS